MSTVILDNQAVQALLDERHPSHRLVLATLDEGNRRARAGHRARAFVPTAVRVEAGWDRTAPGAANANRLVRQDVALDRRLADVAARLRAAAGVSVVDATVAAVVAEAAPPVLLLTSDLDDMRRLTVDTPRVRLVLV